MPFLTDWKLHKKQVKFYCADAAYLLPAKKLYKANLLFSDFRAACVMEKNR